MRAYIEVRDRGVGFDVKRITEAMRAFGQLDRERQEQQGGGLGLSIALGYARINRGGIEFEAREGGGTTARVLLPLVESPED
jgi:signal transduction histidine kinase